jgi:uncharacterized repeat protein (TIGR01451 family)
MKALLALLGRSREGFSSLTSYPNDQKNTVSHDVFMQKPRYRRYSRGVIAVLALAVAFTAANTAHAQTSSPSSGLFLPLVSIGDSVGWKIGSDDYRLVMPQGAAGRSTGVEVYSPEINLDDYANKRNRATYYGDELYGKTATLTTRFQVSDPASGTIANASFRPTRKHSWVQLFWQALQPGVYPLRVTSVGNGKNSFAVRAANGARIEASQFTVNARGQFNQDQVVGFIEFGQFALGKTIQIGNYDADGPQELQLSLVLPNGQRRALTSSPDTKWALNEFKVTRELLGPWKVLAQIKPTTKQFSNSFAIRVRLDGKPWYVTIPGFNSPRGQPENVVPLQPPPPPKPTGTLKVNAVALSCGVPTTLERVGFTINNVKAQTPASFNLETGEYVITPDSLPGSSGRVAVVNLSEGDTREVTLEYTVNSVVALEPSSLNLSIGQETALGLRVTNGFPFPVPITVKLSLPDGLTAVGPTTFEGLVSASRPFNTAITVRAEKQISNGQLLASLEPNCGPQATTSVSAVGQAQLKLEKTVDRQVVRPGEKVNYTITVTNTGTAAANDIQLTDNLPDGISGDPLRQTFNLEPGASRQFTVPATVAATANGNLVNTATATLGAQRLNATATVRVEQPQLKLEKTVDKATARPGEAVKFTITVTNTGNAVARGIKLTDALPAGLTGQNLEQTFDLEPGASRQFTVPATVAATSSGNLVNTAQLSFEGAETTAQATVRVPAEADLVITKTIDNARTRPGETVAYTLKVTNNGPSSASNVSLTDKLPVGLSFVSAVSSQGNCTEANGAITCALGNLTSGASATVTVRANVTNTASGKLTNAASVTATETDPVPANNTARATTEVIAPPPPPAPPPPAPPPTPGNLRVSAVALSCNTRSPITGTAFTLNNQRYTTPANVSLAPGEYTIQPEVVPGSNISPLRVTVREGQDTAATLEYTVTPSLRLTPKTLDLKLGQTTNLTATASTSFPYPIPTAINLSLPDGLSATGPVRLDGQISLDKPLSLTVPVRATKPIQDGAVQASLEPNCGITDTATVNATPNELPPARRESEVVLLARLADNPTQGYIVLSDKLPANANYIPGSSRLIRAPALAVTAQPTTGEWTPNPQQPTAPIGDPLVSGDRLFWVLPVNAAAVGRLSSNTNREVSSRQGVNSTVSAADTSLGVVYRLAHTGALEMPRDRVGVLLVLPNSRSAGEPRNTVKLDPNSTVGKLVGQGELRLVQGDTSVLEAFASARPFGTAPTASATAQEVGGPAVRIRISPLRLTDDPVSQPALLIEAFDQDGKPANDPFVTLEVTPEPSTPDAAPNLPGYQAKLENGVAVVQLSSLTQPYNQNPPVTEVTAEARITNVGGTISSSLRFNAADLNVTQLEPSTFPVTTQTRPWVAVGAAGVQANVPFGGQFSVAGSLGAFARGPIFGDAILTIAVNWRANFDGTFNLSGSLLPPANPYERFPLLGDSSIIGSDARSSEGTYIKLESGPNYLMYGQINTSLTGLLGRYTQDFNGVQGVLRTDTFGLNAFAAWVPNANDFFRAAGDVSDTYLIGKPVVESSERVTIVTEDRFNPALKTEVVLVRGRDYQIDYGAGVIKLARPLTATDANGNPQFLEARFASSVPSFGLRAGAQARFDIGALTLSATGLYFDPVQGRTLFSGGLGYASDNLQFGIEASYSGALGLAAQFNANSASSQFNLRYQELFPGYIDPNSNATSTGRALQAGATFRFSPSFSLNGTFAHNQYFDGTRAGQADNAFGLGAQLRFGALAASLGLAGRLEYTGGAQTASPLTGLWLTAGLEFPVGPFSFGLTQRVPITPGTYGQTALYVDYAISQNFGIRLTDTLTYEPAGVRQQIGLGARGTFTNAEILRVLTGNEPETPETFGTTNIAATYDLDTVDGNAGRARVGIDTVIPLGSNFSMQLGGELLAPTAAPTTGGVYFGLLYAQDGTRGSARASYSILPTGIKQVYTLGVIFQTSPEFVFSPNLEYANGPDASYEGGRFSIAAAWRADDWSLLTNHTGRFGFYAPRAGTQIVDTIQGELWAGYQASERFYLRFGGAYLLTATDFTGKLAGGVTYFFTDTLGAGLGASYIFNPSTGLSSLVFGVEGSLRVLDGLLFTVGLNLNSATGFGAFSVSPGLYFRIDWKFDERTFGLGR